MQSSADHIQHIMVYIKHSYDHSLSGRHRSMDRYAWLRTDHVICYYIYVHWKQNSVAKLIFK